MELKELVEIKSDYHPMKAGDYNLRDVYRCGEETASKLGICDLETLCNFDLYDLIKRNGGTVHHIDLADLKMYGNIFENTIYVHKEGDFDIILPKYAPFIERRYTMTHEIAHYILHSEPVKCYACRNGDAQIENEANCFALGFLMPSELFDQAYKNCNNNINEIAIAFRVPVEIVQERIKFLSK